MYKSVLLIALLLSHGVVVLADETLPDPTRPLEYSETKTVAAQLKLNSVLISGERKVAVINGQQLQENQWLGDKRVVHIRSNSVTLEDQGQLIVLSLYSKAIRQ